MAADLAARGFHVNLYNRTAERIREIALRGEIELERENGAFCVGRLATVTSDVAEALDGADAIMVAVPASGHREIARSCVPHLRNNPFAQGQIVSRVDARGACVAVDPVTGRALSEEERLSGLGVRSGQGLRGIGAASF